MMARKTEEIVNSMETEEVKYAELSELRSNGSKVSIWKYLKWVVALAIRNVEEIVDSFKKEIDNKLITQEVGSITWYIEKAKQYQHEDILVVNNNIPGYAIIDTDKQIISQASVVEEENGSLTLKLAKEVGGILIPLEEKELIGFESYINKVKFAGTKINLVSLPADEMHYFIYMTLDKNKYPYNQGNSFYPEDGPNEILEAMQTYHKTLDFNSKLYVSKLVDELQKIEGVIDVTVAKAYYHVNGTAHEFEKVWTSTAGHVKLANQATRIIVD